MTDSSDYSSDCSVCIPDRCPPNVIQRNYFYSIITPLSDLKGLYSNNPQGVQFIIRKKGGTVILQWEPFQGVLTTNGVKYLEMAQTLPIYPPYTVTIPIYIEYKSVGRITHLEVPGQQTSVNPDVMTVKFYLNTDGSATDINAGDQVFVPGGAISFALL